MRGTPLDVTLAVVSNVPKRPVTVLGAGIFILLSLAGAAWYVFQVRKGR